MSTSSWSEALRQGISLVAVRTGTDWAVVWNLGADDNDKALFFQFSLVDKRKDLTGTFSLILIDTWCLPCTGRCCHKSCLAQGKDLYTGRGIIIMIKIIILIKRMIIKRPGSLHWKGEIWRSCIGCKPNKQSAIEKWWCWYIFFLGEKAHQVTGTLILNQIWSYQKTFRPGPH